MPAVLDRKFLLNLGTTEARLKASEQNHHPPNHQQIHHSLENHIPEHPGVASLESGDDAH